MMSTAGMAAQQGQFAQRWARFMQRLFPTRPHVPERSAESRQFPMLLNLLHAYFNQDYDVISGTADDVIREYRDSTSIDMQQALIAEIETFLARYNTSPSELRSSYQRILTPDGHFEAEWGLSIDQALRRIVEQLSAIAAAPPHDTFVAEESSQPNDENAL